VAGMLAHIAISTRIWEEVHKEGLTTMVGFGLLRNDGQIQR